MGRATRIFLIAFQVLFLNVFLPGHTRGVVTLSGRSSSIDAGCGSCCSAPRDGQHGPTQEDRAQCAVCFFAARVTQPPVVDVRLTELGLREVMPLPPPTTVALTPDLPLAYHGRAPPAV